MNLNAMQRPQYLIFRIFCGTYEIVWESALYCLTSNMDRIIRHRLPSINSTYLYYTIPKFLRPWSTTIYFYCKTFVNSTFYKAQTNTCKSYNRFLGSFLETFQEMTDVDSFYYHARVQKLPNQFVLLKFPKAALSCF